MYDWDSCAKSPEPVIINTCLTGMIPTKDLNPKTPVEPWEIYNDVIDCAELGATLFHIHARDSREAPTYKKEIYEDIIAKIREDNDDVILCVSTSGRDFKEFEKRSEVLEIDGDLKPDMASLTLGSLNFPKQASVNSPQMVQDLATKMKDNGIKPELEVFNTGMINYSKYMIKKGILEPPFYYNILLGSLGSAEANPAILAHMVEMLPEDSYWSVAGIGNYQLYANTLGLAMGGGVRVGLEDNIYFDRDKQEYASNVKLVERIVNITKVMNRELATPEYVRNILNLNKK
jgi:3-keto-5-aminohexanoate cleavage enzyme